MKKFLSVLSVMAVMLVMLTSCQPTTPSSNQQLAQQQEALMREANREIGMPAINNFQERKLMKAILELRDKEDLVCYAYIIAEMTGKPMFLGRCIGYGLPYGTQYTNPQVEVFKGASLGYVVLPQADPNGLFMPQSADGTWLMMLDNKGESHPVYCEPKVLISPFPLGNTPNEQVKEQVKEEVKTKEIK